MFKDDIVAKRTCSPTVPNTFSYFFKCGFYTKKSVGARNAPCYALTLSYPRINNNGTIR